MYIHNTKHAGTSASIRTTKVIIVSTLFATTLLVGGNTPPAEASKTPSRQSTVGKIGNPSSVKVKVRTHPPITGYSREATQKNLRFLKNRVQKMDRLSKARLECITLTNAPDIQCVLTHVDTTANTQMKQATFVALLSLNAHDALLSLTRSIRSLSVLPERLKGFIYDQAKNVLDSLYRVAENQGRKARESNNTFLVEIYRFHTKKPQVDVKKKPSPSPSYSNRI